MSFIFHKSLTIQREPPKHHRTEPKQGPDRQSQGDMSLDLSRNHVPGYGGFVSNTREDFGRTFGHTTRDALRVKVDRPDGPFPLESVHPAPYGRRSLSASGKINSPKSPSPVQGLQSQTPTGTGARSRGGPTSPDYYRTDQTQVAPTLDRAPNLEEQHMPGYSGYVSPLRMPHGRTFGHGSKVAVHVKEQALSDARNHHGSVHNPPPVDATSAVLELPKKGLFEPNSSDSKPEFDQPNEHKLPGYSAFIPGSQHHYGRTYGHMTRNVERSPEKRWPYTGLPPKDGVGEEADGNHHFERNWEQEQIPGYTGFIRHAKDDYGKTYGRLTRERLGDGRAEVQLSRTQTQAEKEAQEQDAIANSAPIPFTDHRPLDPSVRTLGEAHHLPGYTGYIHRAEHKIAKTYGQITREVTVEDSQSPDAPVSPLAYLQNPADAQTKQPPQAGPDTTERWEPFVPTHRTLGYTGYRPGTKYTIAQTYGKSTRATEEKLYAQQVARNEGSSAGAPSSPLKDVHLKQDSDPPVDLIVQNTSGHLPGYTGYLPHNQDIIAKTYGETSRDSLKMGASPTLAQRDPGVIIDQGAHRRKGHLPGYTGFVPGFDHDYGETYGKLTREHINEFTTRSKGLK